MPPDTEPTLPLFDETDPRTDVICAQQHLRAARVRLGRHPRDNVFRDMARELDIAEQRLEERLRAYPAHRPRGFQVYP